MEFYRLEAFRLPLGDIVDVGLVVGEQRRRRIGEDFVARAAEELVERHAGLLRRHVPERDVDQRMRLRHHRRAEVAQAVPERLALGRVAADHIRQDGAQRFADRAVEIVRGDHRRAGDALRGRSPW